ncbi:MAG TPA: hypothetical protein PK082_02350 [Phycisphaerae bacterium]|nr:hypothetical protein [Phycisphaerae bacterium]
MRIGAVTKRMFFDSAAVVRSVDAATRKVLSKFGAFVRTAARTSIRPRKAPSAPGEPPHSHTGDLRRRILFAYDPASRSVVVGPTLFHHVQLSAFLGPGVSVPELLEHGGKAGVIETAVRFGGHMIWVRRDLRRMGKVALIAALRENLRRGRAIKLGGGNVVVPAGQNRFRTYTLAARPYMGPAMMQELPKLPALWAGSVTRGAA